MNINIIVFIKTIGGFLKASQIGNSSHHYFLAFALFLTSFFPYSLPINMAFLLFFLEE